MKIKKIFKKWRVIILILFLLFALISISPQTDKKGVIIKAVNLNSSAYNAGIKNPNPNLAPTKHEKILYLESKPVNNMEDYTKIITSIKNNTIIHIKTDKQEYTLLKTEDIGLTVAPVPSSNIRKGLELEGGTRVLVQATEKITSQERDDLIATMENRLNVYGLTDLKIKPVDGLLNEKYVSIELAGATEEEVRELIGKQGNFEAKIGNETVFIGGHKDIVHVCRNDGSCSGIRECHEVTDGHYCKFEFVITLSEKAAQKHAQVTRDIPINTTTQGLEVLEKTIDFYLDDTLVDSLQIMADLKGKEATRIAISGPGFGSTREEAINLALKNMNKLQTILITGSLPFSLEIVKLDSISPTLGKTFIKSAYLIALVGILLAGTIIFIRYRKIKISLIMILITASEAFIILGLAAFFRYNLDLAAIAGIIAAVGTGLDDQIVIADEITRKESFYSWKDRIKKAFFIIFAAYATTVAAMLPLLKAGAGLLIGFALVTIAGVSIGVFVTRPAFAAILEEILEK
jgi:preprotein translocase subunit SecD